MEPILVLCGTRERHTRRIAEHVGATLRTRGLPSEVRDVGTWPADGALAPYAAAIVAATESRGEHDPAMVAFVKAHAGELEAMPAALLSLRLCEWEASNARPTAEERAAAAADARGTIVRFLARTGLRPERVRPAAGGLVYTEYGRFVRFAMRMITKRAGATSDLSHDHEFTDWIALDRLVDDVAAELAARGR